MHLVPRLPHSLPPGPLALVLKLVSSLWSTVHIVGILVFSRQLGTPSALKPSMGPKYSWKKQMRATHLKSFLIPF